ncbi:uncharacterized protein PgNI_09634, partial [Pyricularia grisea]|uniref:Uncharacterized protein n=1 Tax=Pyricularia grisea TaxID=148305 RepID=A0A6P8ASJ2_PYRGI
ASRVAWQHRTRGLDRLSKGHVTALSFDVRVSLKSRATVYKALALWAVISWWIRPIWTTAQAGLSRWTVGRSLGRYSQQPDHQGPSLH